MESRQQRARGAERGGSGRQGERARARERGRKGALSSFGGEHRRVVLATTLTSDCSRWCAASRVTIVARRSVHPSRICQLRERRIVRSIARDAIPAVAVVVALVVTVVTVVLGVTLKICGSEETDGGAPPVAERSGWLSAACARSAGAGRASGREGAREAAAEAEAEEEDEAGQEAPARGRRRG